MTSADALQQAQGGGYPPGGYGGGPPPGGGGYGPPGGPGGYGPPGPGGYGPPGPGGGPPGYGPPGPPYGAPYPQPGAPQGAPQPPRGPLDPEFKKRAQLWLVIGAVSSVLCSCLFGVIGAVFAYMAMQASDQGNAADAENKLRWGKIITIVGLVVGTALSVVSMIYASRLAQMLTEMITGGS